MHDVALGNGSRHAQIKAANNFGSQSLAAMQIQLGAFSSSSLSSSISFQYLDVPMTTTATTTTTTTTTIIIAKWFL